MLEIATTEMLAEYTRLREILDDHTGIPIYLLAGNHDRREQLLKAAYYEVLRDSAKVENYYAKKILNTDGLAN